MTSLNEELWRGSRRLHVDTLVRLRFIALLGQAAAVLFTRIALGFPLPLVPCLAIIAVSAALNVALRIRYGRVEQLDERPAAAILAYDLLQLTGLLFLTGGIENPFSMLLLAPIIVSAMSLSGYATLKLTLLAVAAASFLTFGHYPLPWYARESFSLPFVYSAGVLTAHVVSAAFIAIYASLVSMEARKLADALTATELVLAREQHLTQLDGLAAAAAHELGTPLATITLVARDLERELPAEGPIREDITLLTQEVVRCRAILGKLASLGDDEGTLLDDMNVSVVIEEVVAPQRDFGIRIKIEARGEGREPATRRNPGILYGLGNLIENAIDFAQSVVRINADWDEDRVRLVIEDDGPGFSPEMLRRAGAPYITTKTDRRAKSEDGAGLGLGLFIAKTLLERSGAGVSIGNVSAPGTGARIAVEWKRANFERGVKQREAPKAS